MTSQDDKCCGFASDQFGHQIKSKFDDRKNLTFEELLSLVDQIDEIVENP